MVYKFIYLAKIKKSAAKKSLHPKTHIPARCWN